MVPSYFKWFEEEKIKLNSPLPSRSNQFVLPPIRTPPITRHSSNSNETINTQHSNEKQNKFQIEENVTEDSPEIVSSPPQNVIEEEDDEELLVITSQSKQSFPQEDTPTNFQNHHSTTEHPIHPYLHRYQYRHKRYNKVVIFLVIFGIISYFSLFISSLVFFYKRILSN